MSRSRNSSSISIDNQVERRITRSCTRKLAENELTKRPYNKIITNVNPKNIVSILINSQITGRAPKNILNVRI